MVARIVIVLVICVAVIYAALWLISGGFSHALSSARMVSNPLGFFFGTSTDGAAFHLPFQPTISGAEIDASDPAVQTADGKFIVGSGNADTDSAATNGNTAANPAVTDLTQSQTFGGPSPLSKKIFFEENSATESVPASEYVSIAASSQNTAPISLKNWTLQSAVTGERFPLPSAAPNFTVGVLNTVAAVVLNPGDRAMITTSVSPVGVSFRENKCTGYLGQFQSFTPPLPLECPEPSRELPTNSQNLSTFGESCVDYMNAIPRCHFPIGDEFISSVPSGLPVLPACVAFAANHLSYNGCIAAHRSDADFQGTTWRIYLGSNVEIWHNSHDVIRLLDEKGRTVDVLTY